MMLHCPFCDNPQEVIKEIGKMRRLACKHLVVYNPDLVIDEPTKDIELSLVEDNKILDSTDQIYLDIIQTDPFKESFTNSKTGDKPYPFQWEGIEFIESSGFRCLIADEMGLGKTIQALGGLAKFKEKFFPCLIIVKSKLKTQWMVQLLNWCGLDFIPQIIMDGKLPPVPGFDVYICSYDIIRKFSKDKTEKVKSKWGHEYTQVTTENPFYSFGFKGIIMDEVQSIKGESRRTMEVENVCKQAEHIVALSGTPIKNNADEFYPILHILKPVIFPDRDTFRKNWVAIDESSGYPKFAGIKHWRLDDWERLTESFILRRTREQVKDQIGLTVTKANRIFHFVDFDNPKTKAAYMKEEAEFIRLMEDDTKKKNPTEIIARLSVARHIIGITKIPAIVEYAEEFLLETGKPLLILTHHQDVSEAVVALLSKVCADGGYDLPLYFKAGLSDVESNEIITKAVNGNMPFLIGSTLAMGEGVDRLQHRFHTMMIAERQWNPANEEQAESRLVRIGQKNDYVDCIYPIVAGSIDEWFTELVEAKRRIMKQTLDKTITTIDDHDLLKSLYEAVVSKGRKKTARGF